MKKTYRCLLLSLLVIGLGVQCKKKPCMDPTNPMCDNYDPCSGKKPTRADFKILEVGDDVVAPRYALSYETDTIIGGDATFAAQEERTDTEYHWEIGAGRYSTKNVTLGFSSVPDRTVIPIKLIVKRKNIDKTCFPMDDGVDTLMKQMTIRRYAYLVPYFVTDTFIFRGYHTDKPSEIRDVKFYRNPTGTTEVIENLIPEHPIIRLGQSSVHYRMLCFNQHSELDLEGVALVGKNDSISIRYEYEIQRDPPIIKKTFIGKKIK